MDIRPVVIAALLLVALVVAVVALPVSLVRQVFSPARSGSDDDETSRDAP